MEQHVLTTTTYIPIHYILWEISSACSYPNTADSRTYDLVNLFAEALQSTYQEAPSFQANKRSRAQATDNPDWLTSKEGGKLWSVAMEMTQMCSQSEYSNKDGLMQMWCDFVQSTCALAERGGATEHMREMSKRQDKHTYCDRYEDTSRQQVCNICKTRCQTDSCRQSC